MIEERAKQVLNLKQFGNKNMPLNISKITKENVAVPKDEQFVNNMLIRDINTVFHIPSELAWTRIFVLTSYYASITLGIKHPYAYLTVMHGRLNDESDLTKWKVEGFNTKFSQIPQQNYVWCANHCIQYTPRALDFPLDFDPTKHDLNAFIQDTVADDDNVYSTSPERIYCFDPYVIRRFSPGLVGHFITHIEVTFSPTPIMDDSNTRNPLLYVSKYDVSKANLNRYKI